MAPCVRARKGTLAVGPSQKSQSSPFGGDTAGIGPLVGLLPMRHSMVLILPIPLCRLLIQGILHRRILIAAVLVGQLLIAEVLLF